MSNSDFVPVHDDRRVVPSQDSLSLIAACLQNAFGNAAGRTFNPGVLHVSTRRADGNRELVILVREEALPHAERIRKQARRFLGNLAALFGDIIIEAGLKDAAGRGSEN